MTRDSKSNSTEHWPTDVLGAFLIGVVTGSIASLLLAPTSGRRTRRAIRREGKRMTRRALEAQEQGRDALERAADAASETLKGVTEAIPVPRR